MRHGVKKYKLNRNMGERKALLRSLLIALFTHEKIITTQAKAKAVKPVADQMVTRATADSVVNRRLLLSRLPNETVVEKLLKDIGPRSAATTGGHTRIINLGSRKSDAAPMVRLELVAARTESDTKAGQVHEAKQATVKVKDVGALGKGTRTKTFGKVVGPERESRSLKEKAVSRRQVSTKKEGKK